MRSSALARVCAAAGLMSAGCAAIDELLNNPSDLAIQKFAVSPKEVPKGATATLSWDVKGADEVQIDNGIGLVKSKGTLEIRADRTTTYTLAAKSGTASASSSVQLMVGASQASPSPSPAATPTPSPTPSPSPSPSPSPTPSPTPSPSPTPTPTPSPAAGCRASSMPECGRAEGPKGVWGCCREERTQVFAEDVERAIDKLMQERPGLFNGDRPKDENAYVRGVAEILERDFGYCAKQGGPEDEVAVKKDNGFSEQYDILLSNGRIRRFGYTVTCRPARF